MQYNGTNGTDTFADMYSYTAAGLVTGKGMQISRASDNGSFLVSAGYGYDGEGRVTSTTYPYVLFPSAICGEPAPTPGVTMNHTIKSFFQWMARQNHPPHNPASEIVLARMEHRLPKYALTAEEAERIIGQPNVSNPEGLRDRAILEAFYSTGMRRMELARLKIYDVDADRTTLTIRRGKGWKDRVIPIGERALAWIDKPLRESRPQRLTSGGEDGTVFETHMGEPFDRRQLTALVRGHPIESKVGKMGGCHLLRHTVATPMLKSGADIRVIQEMLGHAKPTTTELTRGCPSTCCARPTPRRIPPPA